MSKIHEAVADLRRAPGVKGAVLLTIDGLVAAASLEASLGAEVVSGLTRGVASLFKKNKIESIRGTGRLLGLGKVEVTAPDASKKTLSAKNIIIATGSSPTPVKGIDFANQMPLA
jgi:pyruvate/2-oxoglutarate dehydrogenase complex dihydrolipoamide dehydrogenase (E3) component